MPGVVGQAVDQFRRLWGEANAIRRQLHKVIQRVAALQTQLSNFVAGSSMTPALTNAADLVYVRATETYGPGLWLAKRLQFNPDAGRYQDDDEDDTDYRVETAPWCSCLFVGARGLAVYLRSDGVYRMIAGEGAGFAAKITGPPDEDDENLYPWQQMGLPESEEAYTNETEIVPGQALGLALARDSMGYDPQITGPRIAFPVDTPIFLRYDQTSQRFWFPAFGDAEHGPCEIC